MNTPCIEWTQTRPTGPGYAQIRLRGKHFYIHRIAAALKYGGIPEGMSVDHLCKNTICYNPDHLRLVSPEENSMGSKTVQENLARTTCLHGHPLDGWRTSNRKGGPGRRYCKTCKSIANARYRASRKAGASSTGGSTEGVGPAGGSTDERGHTAADSGKVLAAPACLHLKGVFEKRMANGDRVSYCLDCKAKLETVKAP